jgi:uncharacterized damage-inducible protein DinB
MRALLSSIEAEYRRYEALAEQAVAQLDEHELAAADDGGNSVATIAWHVSGNLVSRFTDFLTTDGEKPWREREGEFAARRVTREELGARAANGWRVLFDTLAQLEDADLARTVTIRGRPLTVAEALHRSLAHTAYHVGQIVLRARALRGERWRFLSIPPGGSAAYDANPIFEKGPRPAEPR